MSSWTITVEFSTSRSVLTDKFRVEAALDVVRQLNWNYIGVISSYGYNGEREALRFIEKLPYIDVCLANQIDLPQQVRGYYQDTSIVW